MNTRVRVVGLGKLGGPIAGVFQLAGFKVSPIDINVGDWSKKADITFIVVPTPSKEDGSFTSEYVEKVLDMMKDPQDVAIVSTLSPKSTGDLANKYPHLRLAYNPTFVALGSVVKDFTHPDFILIGCRHQDLIKKLMVVYRRIIKNPKFAVMTPLEAEITKITLNCYITNKITFANQIGNVCWQLGIKPDNILNAVGMDSRVGNKYFRAGLGYGGPCFPRDNRALATFMKENGGDPTLFDTIDELNKNMVGEILSRLSESKGMTIGFKSLSYKDGTDCTECSQLLELHDLLKQLGYKVKIGKGEINIDWSGICEF